MAKTNNKKTTRAMVAAPKGKVTPDCNECAAVHEPKRGETVFEIRIGNHVEGLCLAHGIKLCLDIRRATQKMYPTALTH